MNNKPKIIAIAAVAVDGTIGIDNEIPWRIPADFKHFRNTTMGGILIVGRTTYETLPEKAFEGRTYLVLNNGDVFNDGRNNVHQFRDVETLMMYLKIHNIDRVFIAGGASIYDAMIDYCNEAVITWVDKTFPNGNKKFPILKLAKNFEMTEVDPVWSTCPTGELYKIAYYIRKNNFKRNANGT
jgi:dihydrofolate reductase